MAVTSGLGAYGGQNLMLMRNDNSADTLVAMLGSCSPHMSLQQVSRSMGVLDDVSGGGGGQKRPYYAAYNNDGPSVEEPEEVDEGADELFSHHVEKKRRLSFDQVRSLERNFEVENKLEPERKMQLAKELGLQPRQVAVWFQNRRARWKIKQLERDYEALTQDYNRLKSDLEVVNRDKSKLKAEVNRLKGVTTTTEDVKAVESTQCRSNTTSHPASPTHSDRSDIDSSRHSSRALPTIDVPAAAATKEGCSPGGMQRSMSYDSNSSDIMDADSPRTSDNSSSRNKNNNNNNNINNSNTTSSSHQPQPEQLADVDGPWSQYPSFPPENCPNLQELCSVPSEQDLALSLHAFHRAGVKLEDMPSGFSGDQAFLLSRLEEQSVLPNWWEWA